MRLRPPTSPKALARWRPPAWGWAHRLVRAHSTSWVIRDVPDRAYAVDRWRPRAVRWSLGAAGVGLLLSWPWLWPHAAPPWAVMLPVACIAWQFLGALAGLMDVLIVAPAVWRWATGWGGVPLGQAPDQARARSLLRELVAREPRAGALLEHWLVTQDLDEPWLAHVQALLTARWPPQEAAAAPAVLEKVLDRARSRRRQDRLQAAWCERESAAPPKTVPPRL